MKQKENPALSIYWAEAMLPDKNLPKKIRERKQNEFIYQYIKLEFQGFDNTEYSKDFLETMVNLYGEEVSHSIINKLNEARGLENELKRSTVF